jgi:hypothetical protein
LEKQDTTNFSHKPFIIIEIISSIMREAETYGFRTFPFVGETRHNRLLSEPFVIIEIISSIMRETTTSLTSLHYRNNIIYNGRNNNFSHIPSL